MSLLWTAAQVMFWALLMVAVVLAAAAASLTPLAIAILTLRRRTARRQP